MTRARTLADLGSASLATDAELASEVSTINSTVDSKFDASNILGTVSQSGGVPTGAIVERGSNSNGEYVKFADGTMICTLPPFDWTFTSTTSASYTWTFPVSFAAAPYAFPGGAARTSSTIIDSVSVGTYAHTATNVVLRWKAATNIDNVREASAIAVGRWF